MRTNDKQFEDAEYFMTCYFHQNWRDVLEREKRPPTVDGCIAYAIDENPPKALQKMAESLRLVLQENFSEAELYELFFKQGSMAHDPRYGGLTLRAFTQYVLDALRRSPKLSTKS